MTIAEFEFDFCKINEFEFSFFKANEFEFSFFKVNEFEFKNYKQNKWIQPVPSVREGVRGAYPLHAACVPILVY